MNGDNLHLLVVGCIALAISIIEFYFLIKNNEDNDLSI